MAKTRLHGFLKGANQITDFIKGETITVKQYNSAVKKIQEKRSTLEADSPKWELYENKEEELKKRLNLGYNYVPFINYTKQLQVFHTRKENGITKDDIAQLAVNNRAVHYLKLFDENIFKYGEQSTDAIRKYKEIILYNDYRKLLYLNTLPEHSLKNIKIEKIKDISLPKEDSPTQEQYEFLQEKVAQMQERLEQLDANRHVNSIEFRRMKAALKAMSETLKKPWNEVKEDDHKLIGEQLEALQDTSMNYVQAKGVGRQSTQLGKDRMDLGLDAAQISSLYMDKFISEKRIKEVQQFETDIEAANHSKDGVCYTFVDEEIDTDKKANIYEDKKRGINEYGKKISQDIEKHAELDDDDDIINEF